MPKQHALYLDHAATTPVDVRVLEAMQPYWSEHFGNTSSIHAVGREAQQGLEIARHRVAEVLGFRLAAGIQGDLRQRLLAHLFAMGPVAAAGQQAAGRLPVPRPDPAPRATRRGGRGQPLYPIRRLLSNTRTVTGFTVEP